jgi:hypothetical protein
MESEMTKPAVKAKTAPDHIIEFAVFRTPGFPPVPTIIRPKDDAWSDTLKKRSSGSNAYPPNFDAVREIVELAAGTALTDWRHAASMLRLQYSTTPCLHPVYRPACVGDVRADMSRYAAKSAVTKY